MRDRDFVQLVSSAQPSSIASFVAVRPNSGPEAPRISRRAIHEREERPL
jgi:hypothetical protein